MDRTRASEPRVMAVITSTFIIVLFLYSRFVFVVCEWSEIDRISDSLNELALRMNENEDWNENKLTSISNNLYEVFVKNISSRTDDYLFEETVNYKFLQNGEVLYLAGSTDSMFMLNVLNEEELRITKQYHIIHPGKIFTFEVMNYFDDNKAEIIVVLSVEVGSSAEMRWYKLIDENFEHFWSWPMQMRVERLQYFRYGNQNRLLTMKRTSRYPDSQYSHGYVYGFTLNGELSDFSLIQSLPISDVLDFKLCPVHNGALLMVQVEDGIRIYDYTNENSKEAGFQLLHSGKFSGLKNFDCFRSGNILYMGISGDSPGIFELIEDEFDLGSSQSKIFTEEITWIASIPMKTWREEVMLLVQWKNSTIDGFEWQAEGFRKMNLSSFGIPHLDLSRVAVIPKFGFVYENRIFKIEATLRQLDAPVSREMERLLGMKEALTGIMRKQEMIFEETTRRVEKSYLKNSQITGYWEIRELESENVIMTKGVDAENLSVGGNNFKLKEFQLDNFETLRRLEKIQEQLNEVRINRVKGVLKNSTDVGFPGDVDILGELVVHGTLTADDVTFAEFNNITVAEMYQDLFDQNDDRIIDGKKVFPSIDVEKLTVHFINGIPIEEIVFDRKNIQYNSTNFDNLKRLVIDGNLNVSYLNKFDWQELMTSTISKSGSNAIRGETTVRGKITASHVNLRELNQLMYPDDYILHGDTDSIEIGSRKKFRTLTVENLNVARTINGTSVDEFILLNKNTNLSKQITFEHLNILGRFELDGNITGGPEIKKTTSLLNETTKISSRVTFSRIKVQGKIEINETINGRRWDDFQDLVSREETVVGVTGRKEFSGLVVIEPGVDIVSGRINGHRIDEFVTLDTDQELNLEMIDGNVTFGQVTRSDIRYLEENLAPENDQDGPRCINRFLTFKVPPIVDKLSVEKVNENISGTEFFMRLNESLNNVTYERLRAKSLKVERLIAKNVNGVKYEELKSRRISKTERQVLTGNFEIDNLDAGVLHAETIDGKSLPELENMKKDLDGLFEKIVNGSMFINNLTVTGLISSGTLNNNSLTDIQHWETMRTVIFESDIEIRNLNISGLLNLKNFLEVFNDSVMKTDRNIIVHGRKEIAQIVCEVLNISEWSGTAVDMFLNPSIHQVLSGPMRIIGKTIIEEGFDEERKIGKIVVKDIKRKLEYITENVFLLNGDFDFTSEIVSIENLLITGSIQRNLFSELHESLIFLNNENTSIAGSKLFRGPVTFSNLMITEQLNDIDLKEFYHNVVLIDEPMFLTGRVNSSENIFVKGDLIVTKKMEAVRLMDVDLSELEESAIYLMKPEFIPGVLTFENAVFDSNIRVEKFNDIDMNNLIPLKAGKMISSVLRCLDITVGNLEIDGRVNNHSLAAIYSDTFQLTGVQNITGNLIFSADVNIRRDLDTKYINGIKPTDFITLYDDEIIPDDVVFKDQILLNGSLRILKKYNGISPLTWQQIAVTSRFPLRQIVSGLWTVNGSVHLKGSITGSGDVNGTDLRKFVDYLRKSDINLSLAIDNREKDLQSMCRDIENFIITAEKQLYKFKFFEYFQRMEFDNYIASVHQFQFKDFDYLFISLGSCQLNGYLLVNGSFEERAVVDGFGIIEEWMTLDYGGDKWFVTLGRNHCRRTPGNLWRLTDDNIINVMNLGDATDARRINDQEFIVLINETVMHYSIEDIVKNSRNPRNSYSLESGDVKFLKNSDEPLIVDDESVRRLDLNSGKWRTTPNVFGTRNLVVAQVGIFQKELFIYYDEKISEDYIFVSDNSSSRISQAIGAYRVSSVVLINFDDFIENFLIYIEDGSRIRIHEYRGIEDFVYRETLRLRGEKLLTFRLRKDRRLVKKHYLGVIDGNRFTILEAKMYGERMEIEKISCN